SAKDDIDIDALAAEIEGAGAAKEQEPQKSKGKKKKEKKKQDFDEDDILKELEELSIEAQGGKIDREPSTGKVENDNEDSLSKQDKKRKGRSKKANLENDYDSEEVEDKDKKTKKSQKAKQDMLSGSDDDDHETQVKKNKGKTQKSNKKHDMSDDDEINIKKSKERAGALSSGESGDESDEVSQTRKGQKKNQKAKSTAGAESGDDEEEPSFKVKTVAQKKAEKKERERKKREEEKAKLRKQKEKEELEGGKEPGKPKEALKKAEEKASQVTAVPGEKGETPAGPDADDNEGDKKKKDKKKKKGEKEEKEKEKKKGPSKATVKAMQEALAKMKEEEERAKREEEERIRRLEELEAKRKEEERLEQERKERKKQKEKERKERLKKEGKLLTKAQREARARAEATLKLLQAQGVEVPSKDSVPKKRPIYEDKKKKKQQQPESKEGPPICFLAISESVEVTSPSEDAVELETPVKEETLLPVEPEEKEEEEETEDGGLDDWEAMVSDEDGEKESKPVHIEVKEQNEVDEEEEEEDDEEEEEEESEESEDSEGSEDEDEKTSDERETDSQAIGKQSMEKKASKEISSDSEYDSDDDRTKEERAYDKAKRRIEKRRAENSKNMNTEKLRAPVICVLGHVDTGKTKILDKLRHTHVQDSEAGGITQQIGATNVPLEAINEQTKMVKNFDRENIKIPGMLIIDTPGHESFSNLRNRGSSLCDIAILVVDIMHGLEPQTIESINLLKSKKCPFIVALNKVRYLFTLPDTDVAVTLKKQKKNTKDEFEERAKAIIVEFAKQGLNAALFYENKDPRTFVSLVPTSAHTGDGMGSLIALLVELTQTMLTKRLAECQELRAQVMEVKALPGMGTTIDVILINGRLKEGDTIIVPGVEGPIVTQIRGLLLPPPMKELRVKNQYEKHKEVVAAQGVKILGKDLEKTLAGLPLLVAYKEDEVPVLKDELIHELKQTLNAIKLEEKGVYVQASTLGSLEALLEFLKTSEVPYSGINIGPVHKKDVMKASVMLEHDPQYAVILAFDVRIERDAQEMADSLGVRIFSAEIIYHLFDAFTKYRQDYKKQKQEEFKHIAVFPCKMKILPQFIFNSRDPIVMGVVVEAGQVKQGTPMCVPSKNFVDIGIVTSIEINHKPVEVAKKGQEVCVKIEPIPGESPKMYGRHFEATDILVSKISRQSIDALKDWFRDEMQKSDWQLIVELKKVFEII
ncbi:IF2P factor, partial [Psilopogon haemacephalus]|nr:IF2P factor [Psilopogon haemacephalus]